MPTTCIQLPWLSILDLLLYMCILIYIIHFWFIMVSAINQDMVMTACRLIIFCRIYELGRDFTFFYVFILKVRDSAHERGTERRERES